MRYPYYLAVPVIGFLILVPMLSRPTGRARLDAFVRRHPSAYAIAYGIGIGSVAAAQLGPIAGLVAAAAMGALTYLAWRRKARS